MVLLYNTDSQCRSREGLQLFWGRVPSPSQEKFPFKTKIKDWRGSNNSPLLEASRNIEGEPMGYSATHTLLYLNAIHL